MQQIWLLLFGMTAAIALAEESSAQGARIAVSSSAFSSGAMIPAQFTCKGANQNPPLQFQAIPAKAKSLAIIVDDPDAPGGTFTHWLVWNIEPTIHQVGPGSAPAGAVQGENDFGKPGYGGPCPPSGMHRYVFHVLALDRKLDLKPGAKRTALDHAIAGHIIGKGELMGRFGR